MAIVGPRPTVQEQVDRYTRAPAPPARGQAGNHRLGAGERSHLAAVARAHRARRLVRGAPLAAARPADPGADRAHAASGHGLYSEDARRAGESAEPATRRRPRPSQRIGVAVDPRADDRVDAVGAAQAGTKRGGEASPFARSRLRGRPAVVRPGLSAAGAPGRTALARPTGPATGTRSRPRPSSRRAPRETTARTPRADRGEVPRRSAGPVPDSAGARRCACRGRSVGREQPCAPVVASAESPESVAVGLDLDRLVGERARPDRAGPAQRDVSP